jgi:N-formylglutamate amidohydrolase
VAAGLGTIPRVVASGEDIYDRSLAFAEARRRIEAHHVPYHAALRRLVDETRRLFGACLLVDCHSMPSIGSPMDRDPGHRRVDVVLGDCHGTSCAPAVVALVEGLMRAEGFLVTRNTPYAGGFTTRHYGAPERGVHALQVEINRSLYMDEATVTRGSHLSGLATRLGPVIEGLAGADVSALAP